MPHHPAILNFLPPEAFRVETSLLAIGDEQSDACQNIQPGNIVLDAHSKAEYSGQDRVCNFNEYDGAYPDTTFLQLVQKICQTTSIKHCYNEGCKTKRKALSVAPTTQWESFREWALTLISCLLHAMDCGMEQHCRSHWNIISELSWLATYTPIEKFCCEVRLFEICELITWMKSILEHVNPSHRPISPIRAHITKETISEALHTASKMHVCPSRLWNVAVLGAERQEVDLHTIATMLADHGAYLSVRHRDHSHCNAEFCCFASVDSTLVKQLHKCSGKDCGQFLRFDIPILEPQSHPQRFSWWQQDSDVAPKIVYEEVAYMAISHVWSDGTGAGVHSEGLVNRCLFEFFKGIATELNCQALWWDTISMPVEKDLRQIAISKMNKHFQDAEHVVIHDEELARRPWNDDGSCCLALLLSTWFTRAWTTLELAMSHREKVSVIFRHPDYDDRYTVKNLETDVLAHHPAYTSRGHWIASTIISQLRTRRFDCIADIQQVLRTKSTSWARDLIVIAGLLTGLEPRVNTPGFIADTTCRIVQGLVEIEESFLYHGHATIAENGGFSWCPSSLLDVHVPHDSELSKVFVDDHGAVLGAWNHRLLSKEDALHEIYPFAFHVSADYRIRAALSSWENCLLLKNDQRKDVRALLVIPVGVGKGTIGDSTYVVLDCQYVGAVSTTLEWGDNFVTSVRIGHTTSGPVESVEGILQKYESTKGPRILTCLFWKQHVNSIRKARSQVGV